MIALFSFAPTLASKIDLHDRLPPGWNASNWPALVAFGLLALVIALAGLGIMFKAAGVQRSGRGG